MKNKNEELRRKIKKAASISLCAVLAGGLAAGTYTGVNYITGYEQNVQAASNKEEVTLLKSDKKSDDSDSKDDSTEETTAKGSLDVSDIVEGTMPSIVSITTKSVEEVQNYYGMFGQYGTYTPEQREVQGSGS